MAQISTTITSQYQELKGDLLEKKEREAEVKRVAEMAKLHELADRLEAAKAAPSFAPPVANINVPACSASTPDSKKTFASATLPPQDARPVQHPKSVAYSCPPQNRHPNIQPICQAQIIPIN
jgi:hypothetical protein